VRLVLAVKQVGEVPFDGIEVDERCGKSGGVVENRAWSAFVRAIAEHEKQQSYPGPSTKPRPTSPLSRPATDQAAHLNHPCSMNHPAHTRPIFGEYYCDP